MEIYFSWFCPRCPGSLRMVSTLLAYWGTKAALLVVILEGKGIAVLSGAHVTHLRKARGGKTLELCLNYVWGQRQNNLYLPSGTDKPIHQAASGAQTEALTPRRWRIYWPCSGTRKLPSWRLFSGSLSMPCFDSLSLLVMLISVSILSFMKETVLHFLCFEYLTGSDSSLAKHPHTCQQTTQWQNQGLYFLSYRLSPHFYILQEHRALSC